MVHYPEFSRLLSQYLFERDRLPTWLAKQLKVNPGTVNRWLNHNSRPDSAVIVIRIADILEVQTLSKRQELLKAAGYEDLELINKNVTVDVSQPMIAGSQRIQIAMRAELLAYLTSAQKAYRRWADVPGDAPDGPSPSDNTQDHFIEMRALPMRVAAYRAQPTDSPSPAVDLLDAIQKAKRNFILGEPGSGKSAALERLAWVTATQTLQRVRVEPDAPLDVPLLARLADYRGEADLTPVLRRAFNQFGPWQLDDASVRLLLWSSNVRFVLLLDGLNELEQAQVTAGRKALRGYLSDYREHSVHISCRTADFDAEQEDHPELQLLPGAQRWTVQELVNAIRYWDDDGASDVRDYLRFHLGEANGKRLYEHLHNDERLSSIARIPLFLWMFKQAASDGAGKLPSNRGELLRSFVRAPRVLGRVPKVDRLLVEQSLEWVGWRMQEEGLLQIDGDALYATLEQAKGKHNQTLDVLRDYLKSAGLLIDRGDERYILPHQLIQEYAAAAHLLRSGQASEQLPCLAREKWWRETCILALWLDKPLHTPTYLFSLMGDGRVDLHVRVAAATILGEVGDPRFVCQPYAGGIQAIEPEMVPVPAGVASLGSDHPEARADEQPQCQVAVAAFALAAYPVTNAEFACFLAAGGYDDASLWTAGGQAWLRGEGQLDPETEEQMRSLFRAFSPDVETWLAEAKRTQAMADAQADNIRFLAANYSEAQFIEWYAQGLIGEARREPFHWRESRFNGANQPVVGINWYEAIAYTAWLTRITGKAYRLPTEVEWEWAAKRNQRCYPWGNEWSTNWQGSNLNRPNPVGVYAQGATIDGIHELAGNVHEWCVSLYHSYPYHTSRGDEQVDTAGLRVLRGGAWNTDPTRIRCACRGRFNPWHRHNDLGFRLASASL